MNANGVQIVLVVARRAIVNDGCDDGSGDAAYSASIHDGKEAGTAEIGAIFRHGEPLHQRQPYAYASAGVSLDDVQFQTASDHSSIRKVTRAAWNVKRADFPASFLAAPQPRAPSTTPPFCASASDAQQTKRIPASLRIYLTLPWVVLPSSVNEREGKTKKQNGKMFPKVTDAEEIGLFRIGREIFGGKH
jgi:hypothetical protein